MKINPNPNPNSNPNIEVNFQDDYFEWKKWDKKPFGYCSKSNFAYFKAEINRAIGFIPSNLRVLEIGFGNGEFLQFCRTIGWSVVGTEANINLVEIAKNHGYDAFYTPTLDSIDSSSYDLVVAFDVIEHMTNENLIEFMKSVKRVLRPEGIFIARFPNGDSPFSRANQHGDFTHLTTIGSGKCRYMSNLLDVRVLYLGGVCLPIFDTDFKHALHSIVARPTWFLIDLFVGLIFFGTHLMTFASPNLIWIIKKGKRSEIP